MAVIPMLYSTLMVQALYEGRKTMTRRTQGLEGLNLEKDQFIERCTHWPQQGNFAVKKKIGSDPDRFEVLKMLKSKCDIGDIVWVRETFKVGAWNYEEETVAFDYKASPEIKKTPWVEFEFHDDFQHIHESTINELNKIGIEPTIDEETETFQYKWKPGESPLRWKPSIHMPKVAARIFLEVTDVRIERLFQISENDAIAEGIEGSRSQGWKNYMVTGAMTGAQTSFHTLWQSIHGKESLNSNPYVFVYEFKRIDKPADWPNTK